MQQRNLGFGILDSMIALIFLAAVTVGIILFNANNSTQKDAKVLSTQTEAFAVAFARYMSVDSNRKSIFLQAQAAPVTLSPQILEALGGYWPIDLSKKNRYGQTPCVTIVKNSDSDTLEAIMYYVGGRIDNTSKSRDLIRNAAIALGSKGGVLLNGSIQGNSGWYINSSALFLAGATQCGGALANDSLAVNLDLLPDWNQSLQPVYSLLRGEDSTSGIQSLPGRLRNANTLKSNIYFNAGTGIILNNLTPTNPTKLAVLYNGQGTGAPTLGLGRSSATKLVSDSFQPDLFFKAGDSCNSLEEGKTVADQGIPGATNNLLSRSTLVCTQNDLLCGSGNYCYLTSIPNQITFRNTTRGIQDAGGQFICPKSVPFAMNVQTGMLGGGQVYSILNKDGAGSPNAITAKLDKNGVFSAVINCPTSGCSPGIRTDYKSGIIDGIGQLISIDLATVTGNSVGMTPGGGSPTYQVIQGAMGNYTTPIGYRVQNGINSCPNVCSSLKNVLGNFWQLLGTQRQSRINAGVAIDNQQLGCACERTDFDGSNPDNYKGISVVINSAKSIIVSATCSNMPIFNKD